MVSSGNLSDGDLLTLVQLLTNATELLYATPNISTAEVSTIMWRCRNTVSLPSTPQALLSAMSTLLDLDQLEKVEQVSFWLTDDLC